MTRSGVWCLWALLIGTPTVMAQESTAKIDFREQIRPILSDKCFACHGPDASTREAGLRLDLADEAADALGADEPEESEVLRRIQSEDPDEQMPPPSFKNRLSEDEIAALQTWIEQGAPYDTHWAFVPLGPSEPPQIGSEPMWESWPRSPIDQFVLTTLLQRGLTPAPPASRTQWLRRVSYDLTGLPPTRSEIEAFLADDSDQAYERVVDRLLESPAYGERMANQWLDVARYSDSYGYQVDRDRFVWPWRDWVIRAFNDNLPYDDFLTWQIAGDLLPNATRDQRLATTFCRLHPQKVEGGSVPEEFRVEYVADRTHTLATAFLGLTLECARCHDHKYDPISQRDYYSLFAYFNNIDEAGLYSYFTSSVPTPTLLLSDDQQEQRMASLNAEIADLESQLADREQALAGAPEGWFESWLDLPPIPEPIEAVAFEDGVGGNNQAVPGVQGQAVQLTGDDGVGLSQGNFTRSQPFSVSLWIKTPDRKERAVVFHRSRAWTDAGSRGYQLLIEDGKLSWSLIHFWPGNAISIQTVDEIPVDEWLHVAVTYDGSSRADGLTIYLNGKAAAIETVRDGLRKEITGGGGDTITIGERFRDRGFTEGCVDEFKVFDVELSRDDVSHLASLAETPRSRDPESAAEQELAWEDFVRHADPQAQALRQSLAARRSERDQLLNQITEIMVMQELPERRPSFVLARGAYDAPTDPVTPRTPEFLTPLDDATPDRLGLAQWLTRPEHPLTARVAVNRLWQLCFGQGLVRTPEDFGSQGQPPTHPRLLDWMAWEFTQQGWDQKALLREIVLSATYRQSSATTAEQYRQDPGNRWLARGPRHRLPAEMIRDGLLFATGILNPQVGGPSVRPYEVAASFKPVAHATDDSLYRRSLYTYWKRTAPAPVMLTLDASKRDVCTVRREQTASPLQSLVLLNDPQLIEAARYLAEQELTNFGGDRDELLTDVFYRLTSRPPKDEERQLLLQLHRQQLAQFAENPEAARQLVEVGEKPLREGLDITQVAAWTVVLNTLMNFDEAIVKR